VTRELELNFPNPIETRSDLFDRDSQLDLIRDTLLSFPRRAVVIKGERVMGKTSLLNVLAEWARGEAGVQVLHLPHVTSWEGFVSEILDGMAGEAHTTLHRMGLRDPSGRVSIRTTTEFVRVAGELSTLAASTFLLVLDELDSMLLNCPDDASANQIMDLILHVVAKTTLPIKFAFTITRTTPQVLRTDASPFLSAARIAELVPWCAAEVRELVTRLAEGVWTFSDEAHAALFAACGGHPYLTKAILYALRTLGLPRSPGAAVSEDDVRAAVDAAVRLPEVNFTLDNIVSVHFSDDERRLLQAVAVSSLPVDRGDQAVHVGVAHELLRRGYLRDESGHLVLAYGLLGDWLADKPWASPAISSTGIPTLVIDNNSNRAFLGATEIPLTLQEYRFLNCLVAHAGTVVDRNTVAVEVWPDDKAGLESGREGRLDALVYRLREELGANAATYVETRRGRGYYANPDHVRLIPGR
jgi:Transcriptional regulatory protein, C terminal